MAAIHSKEEWFAIEISVLLLMRVSGCIFYVEPLTCFQQLISTHTHTQKQGCWNSGVVAPVPPILQGGSRDGATGGINCQNYGKWVF